jgi:hypothetical protein
MQQLLSEAEAIRGAYQQTKDTEERAKLKAKYLEIDRQITELRRKPTPSKSKKQSLTLSKSSLTNDALAIDLLNICQSVTADGAISDAEIGHLRQWLKDADESEVSAVAFLRDVVELICKDGVITEEERKQLYSAIETVLPPDLRKFARQRRKIADALEKEKQRDFKAVMKGLEKAAKEASRSVLDADFMVAGVQYEGRGDIILRNVRPEMEVFLVREPSNKHSRHATGIVLANGLQIGYVPEEDAQEFAPLLDQGYPYTARVKKILTGGRAPIPVVVTAIYNSGAPVDGLRTQRDNPTLRPQKKGWFG